MIKQFLLAVALLFTASPLMASASVVGSLTENDTPTWQADKICPSTDASGSAFIKVVIKANDKDTKTTSSSDLMDATKDLASDYSTCYKKLLTKNTVENDDTLYLWTQMAVLSSMYVSLYGQDDDNYKAGLVMAKKIYSAMQEKYPEVTTDEESDIITGAQLLYAVYGDDLGSDDTGSKN
jgi:hypothetical protein